MQIMFNGPIALTQLLRQFEDSHRYTKLILTLNEHVIFNSIVKLTVLYTGGTCIPEMGTANSVVAG